jgi:hypothetical protein
VAPVFSTKFVEAAAFSGAVSYRYTVPAGYIAVVKSMSITWGNASLFGIDAWIQTDSLAKLFRRTIDPLGSDPQVAGGTAIAFGSWVLEAGQQLGVETGVGTVDLWAGGYLLTLP